jgi:hypothetical protein
LRPSRPGNGAVDLVRARGDRGAPWTEHAGADLRAHEQQQKTVLALQKSGITNPAWIASKKRPCLCCYHTLRYAKEVGGLNVSFQDHEGGYWDTSLPGFVELAKQLGHTDDSPLQWIESHPPTELSQSLKLAKGVKRSTLVEQTGATPKLKDPTTDPGYGDLSDSDAD